MRDSGMSYLIILSFFSISKAYQPMYQSALSQQIQNISHPVLNYIQKLDLQNWYLRSFYKQCAFHPLQIPFLDQVRKPELHMWHLIRLVNKELAFIKDNFNIVPFSLNTGKFLLQAIANCTYFWLHWITVTLEPSIRFPPEIFLSICSARESVFPLRTFSSL